MSKQNRIVEALAALSNEEWSLLTNQMSWVKRRGGPVPRTVKRLFGFEPKPTVWNIVRKAVTKRRREIQIAANKARQEAFKERRRTYMRQYRARKREQTHTQAS